MVDLLLSHREIELEYLCNGPFSTVFLPAIRFHCEVMMILISHERIDFKIRGHNWFTVLMEDACSDMDDIVSLLFRYTQIDVDSLDSQSRSL